LRATPPAAAPRRRSCVARAGLDVAAVWTDDRHAGTARPFKQGGVRIGAHGAQHHHGSLTFHEFARRIDRPTRVATIATIATIVTRQQLQRLAADTALRVDPPCACLATAPEILGNGGRRSAQREGLADDDVLGKRGG